MYQTKFGILGVSKEINGVTTRAINGDVISENLHMYMTIPEHAQHLAYHDGAEYTYDDMSRVPSGEGIPPQVREALYKVAVAYRAKVHYRAVSRRTFNLTGTPESEQWLELDLIGVTKIRNLGGFFKEFGKKLDGFMREKPSFAR
jgi:hypothetical protein